MITVAHIDFKASALEPEGSGGISGKRNDESQNRKMRSGRKSGVEDTASKPGS